MANSTNDRNAQGANDEHQNKDNSGKPEAEKSSEQKAAIDPNHQNPENSWSPSNESERQSHESEGDRNFDKGGDGLKESSNRDSSNSLYTQGGAEKSKGEQHSGTISENQDRDLSNEDSWKTGSSDQASDDKELRRKRED